MPNTKPFFFWVSHRGWHLSTTSEYSPLNFTGVHASPPLGRELFWRRSLVCFEGLFYVKISWIQLLAIFFGKKCWNARKKTFLPIFGENNCQRNSEVQSWGGQERREYRTPQWTKVNFIFGQCNWKIVSLCHGYCGTFFCNRLQAGHTLQWWNHFPEEENLTWTQEMNK